MSLSSYRFFLVIFTFFFSFILWAGTSDVGEVRFANSGKPEAQSFFLRGLAQLHNFEYDDAAKAFRQAQKTDPDFAMAFWGEAMTENHPIWMEQDREAAREILKRLGPNLEARLPKAPTQREKDYLQAVEILFGDGEKRSRDLAYADAMADLHRKYPDDPDAAVFYGLALLGTAHEGRDFPTYMRAAAVLEEVFQTHPNHPGAVHYLIHSYDDPIHAPLGLRAARVYSKIAPSAAHAQHMTSHIFLAMGMWEEVVTANENAVSVGGAHHEAGHTPRACGHYHFWLLYGYLQLGRQQDAKSILKACHESARKAPELGPNMPEKLDPDNSDLGSYVEMRARYLLDTENWKSEIADWSVSTGKRLAPKLTQDFVAGFRAVRLGEIKKAQDALELVRKGYQDLEVYTRNTKDADKSYLQRAEILKQQLEALILLAEGNKTEAVDLLGRAAAAEEKVPLVFGPPFVDKPSRELLGEVLLQLGRPREAAVEFEAALARAPERTSSLLGLAQAASGSGNKEKAEETHAKLREIWKHADHIPDEVR